MSVAYAISQSNNGRVINTCNLSESEFINTSLATLDFSTCEIHQVIIPMEQLKGLTVSTEQAVQLAQLLGLKIV